MLARAEHAGGNHAAPPVTSRSASARGPADARRAPSSGPRHQGQLGQTAAADARSQPIHGGQQRRGRAPGRGQFQDGRRDGQTQRWRRLSERPGYHAITGAPSAHEGP